MLANTCRPYRGSRGTAVPLGMSAYPIIGRRAKYLALKLCHRVAHNPNIDLLILTFDCTRINKKLCLLCLNRRRGRVVRGVGHFDHV